MPETLDPEAEKVAAWLNKQGAFQVAAIRWTVDCKAKTKARIWVVYHWMFSLEFQTCAEDEELIKFAKLQGYEG